MPIYAIGDVQGCYSDLRRLLDRVEFEPARDRLWFAGDLVNRGPDSLSVLRFVRDLGDRALSVLGNHDLHLLAVAHGGKKAQRKDNFHDVLEAPDAEELLRWLRHRPLMHHDPKLGYTLVHAGIHPRWSLKLALELARTTEQALRGDEYRELLRDMYGNKPCQWSKSLSGLARLRFVINCFTRMRYVDSDDRLDLKQKGPPGSQPAGLLPWYASKSRKTRGEKILFGHWSTHGGRGSDNVVPLDTGCLWGGQLTAVRLDKAGKAIRIDCPGARRPG